MHPCKYASKKVGNTPLRDCELGMILIDADSPERRWQGSAAAEEIWAVAAARRWFAAATDHYQG